MMFRGLIRSSPTLWITAERVLAQGLNLLILAVQAPILGPRAFGLVAVVMVFVGFWEGVPASAAQDALISIRNIERLHFSTVTAICTLASFVLGAVLFIFSQPIAAALGDVELTSVMRAMAVVPLIQALSIAPTATAQRGMLFRSITLRTVASLLAGGVVGLVLTLTGSGVWALVWQVLVQRCIATAVLWLAVPIPFSFAISRRHFRELFGFAWPVMFARIMSWASGQMPRLIVGFYLGPTDLGLLTFGTRLHDLVNQVAIGPKAMVARIDLRRFAANSEALGKAVRRVVSHISLVSFPACVGGAVVVPTLFHAWLDQRWYAAVIPSEIMLLMGVPYVTILVVAVILLALNRQRWEACVSAVQGVTIIIAVAVAAPHGLVAAVAAIAAGSVATIPFLILVLRQQCGIALRDILLPQVPAFVAACLMGATILILRILFRDAFSSKIMLPVEVVTGALSYAILLMAVAPKPAIRIGRRLIETIAQKLIVPHRSG
jgi:O-antigen/teichoic acid export membrane protein